MQVERKFAPLKIVIESQEDKEFLLKVLDMAYRGDLPFYKPFGYAPTTSFQQKIEYLRGKLF